LTSLSACSAGDVAAQRRVAAALEPVVEVAEVGDARGVEGEGLRPSAGAGVGARPDAGQAVELAHGGGDPVLHGAAGGDQLLDRGALVVDPRAGRRELRPEAPVAAEQAGGETALGLQFLTRPCTARSIVTARAVAAADR